MNTKTLSEIIDSMAKIKSYEDLEEIVDRLKSYNWNYVPPELDGQGWRRFFVKVKEDKRDCHLHLMLEDEEHWERQLKFRDKLREQNNLAKEYAEDGNSNFTAIFNFKK